MSAKVRSWSLTVKCAWTPSPVTSSIVISYRPGGKASIVSTVDVTSACSFLAIDEETKMPRWPTLSCTMYIDDALAADLDFLLVGVGVQDPVERLLRRRDVVAERGEDDDRRTDPLQNDGDPVLEPGLAASELVADEQLLDDPVHLLLVEELVAAPPLFELEEALALPLRRG